MPISLLTRARRATLGLMAGAGLFSNAVMAEQQPDSSRDPHGVAACVGKKFGLEAVEDSMIESERRIHVHRIINGENSSIFIDKYVSLRDHELYYAGSKTEIFGQGHPSVEKEVRVIMQKTPRGFEVTNKDSKGNPIPARNGELQEAQEVFGAVLDCIKKIEGGFAAPARPPVRPAIPPGRRYDI